MSEEWRTIEDFPNYMVSDQGQIANRDSGRVVKLSRTRGGLMKVGLVREGRQMQRGVALIVASAFVEGKDDIFNTPIHLDGIPSNNAADNLVWRPRWFAWKFFRQFEEGVVQQNKKVRDPATGRVYRTMMEAAKAHGLLVHDIWMSVYTGTTTFPTGQTFVLER